MIKLEGKYTSAILYADTIEEGVYSQVYDIINSPAFKGQKVVCMPDVHVGASGPCGLVATIGDYVCPEHIGVDIGCSVSMMILDKKLPQEKYAEFENEIKQKIPFGFNINDRTIITPPCLYSFLNDGFDKYRAYWPEMLNGLPTRVDEKWVSDKLKVLGMDEATFYRSLGSVGGGNHFIEYDEDENKGAVTLHFGSRNFGVKVCKYWMSKTSNPLTKEDKKRIVNEAKKDYEKSHSNMAGFQNFLSKAFDRANEGHLNGYLNGDNMAGYLQDMCFAQLYASYNHRIVQYIIEGILKKYGIGVEKIIKTTHNFIDLRDHTLRKSAIRSYAGEEIIVPFNMRDGVAICEGKSNPLWLNSCAHGAGRLMSRTAAKRDINLEDFKASMKGIYSTTVCEGTVDESPMAYKNTEEIINLISDTCNVKHFMKPKINIKAV